MGVKFNTYLHGSHIYGCKYCHTHLSIKDNIISRDFRGQLGKAYLFDKVVNVIYSDPAKRSMLTGDFIVRDISCNYCKHTVGWTYDKAFKSSEEYKVGKFILEVKVLAEVK